MNELSKKLATLSEEEIAQIYKLAFGTPEGKLVLEDLKNRCFFNTTVADGLDICPHRTLINEGKRCVVLHIDTQINYEPPEKEVTDVDV